MPSVCIIFEATGPYNAIGKIAMAQAQAALAAGWKVSIVAKRLHESLQPHVEWLKLYVPPRGFALQWLSARHFIRKALGDPARFDVIHGHQPQIADLCHIYQCHFLTRAAYERKCLLDNHGLRRIPEAIQKQAVLAAEDRYYRNFSPNTHLLFNSALTRDNFQAYYRLPPKQEIFLYPSPPWHAIAPEERQLARSAFGLPLTGTVLGFLGGLHERKGYRRVIEGLRSHKDIVLLFGGLHSDGFAAPELAGHFRSLGLVRNTAQFYAAIDCLVLASHFEPYGYVASEAAARGIPTIASREVGALPHLLEHRAGAAWDPTQSLPDAVRHIVSHAPDYKEGCAHYTGHLSESVLNRRLFHLYRTAAKLPISDFSQSATDEPSTITGTAQ